eukprot:scaffold35461_cov35-Tisochrysis_lutea.AAC.2
MGYEVHASPNPVRLCDAEKLIAQLSSQLDPPPDWLQGKHLAGIGGHNSLFAVALRALKGKGGDESGASLSTLEMRHALLNVVDKDDAQLMSVAGLGPHADRPLVVVPKVSLLIAVAEHLQLSGVTYLRMTGSCAVYSSIPFICWSEALIRTTFSSNICAHTSHMPPHICGRHTHKCHHIAKGGASQCEDSWPGRSSYSRIRMYEVDALHI